MGSTLSAFFLDKNNILWGRRLYARHSPIRLRGVPDLSQRPVDSLRPSRTPQPGSQDNHLTLVGDDASQLDKISAPFGHAIFFGLVRVGF
jgi:hypothetical protein